MEHNFLCTQIVRLMRTLFLYLFLVPSACSQSVSGNIEAYREVCCSAAANQWCFDTFRSIPAYVYVVEGGPAFSQMHGDACADYLRNYALPSTRSAFLACEKLDQVGSPEVVTYAGLGTFSGTTLRYMIVANQIQQFFSLPNNATVVELGGGFGGQCYVLNTSADIKNYYLIDLPEVTPLIKKVLLTVGVLNATTYNPDDALPNTSIDLFISNYAFSECDQTTQLEYFDRVIKRAKRGYMLYNTTPSFTSLSYQALVTLLQSSGITAHVYEEPVKTHEGNVLIVWGELDDPVNRDKVAHVFSQDKSKNASASNVQDTQPFDGNSDIQSCLALTASNANHQHAIVFTYLGSQLPPYLYDAVYQARLFNQCPIYILANQDAIACYSDCKNLDVTMIPVESLEQTSEHKLFIQNSTINRTFRNGFWFYASERFFYVNELMRHYNLEHVVMLEPDVMLYRTLAELMPLFQAYYHGVGATFSNDNLAIPGLVYLHNAAASQALTECFARHAHEAKNDCEMLAILNQETDVVQGLPVIMPAYTRSYVLRNVAGDMAKMTDLYTCNSEAFNSIFDARAFGMYLGGVDPRNSWDPQQGPGHISEYCVINPANVGVVWELDEKKRTIPFVIFAGKKYRLNNLHIHSKKLTSFLSLDKE